MRRRRQRASPFRLSFDNGDSFERWFRIEFHHELELLVCLSNQRVVTMRPDDGDVEVRFVAFGIRTGRWSTDGEVLCLCVMRDNGNDGNPSLITLNSEFVILREVAIFNDSDATATGLGSASLDWQPDGTKLVLSIPTTNAKGQITTQTRWYDQDTLELNSLGREEDGSGKLVRHVSDVAGVA